MKTHDTYIQENIRQHERIATLYTKRHSEIYNSVEQARLAALIGLATGLVKSGSRRALDFGCGDGNLTRHILHHGFHVICADVTPSFTRISSAIDPNATTPHILNGRDLTEFGNGIFDFIATYSVLHHVPDYLHIVSEMIRILSPGVVLVIDHEASSEYWTNSPLLAELRSASTAPRSPFWYMKRIFSVNWWIKRFRKFRNPRYSEEGDIHVWPDDHIEWDKIRSLMVDAGLELCADEDYLLYQPQYSLELYEQYRNRCSDMHVIVARKPLRA